jgi:CheY-like chemotaxis protein
MEKKILVVEDNLSIRQLIKFLLEKEGYGVQLAVNGTDAILKATEYQPHMIIMDVMMRESDGFQTCRRLKSMEETKDIPVMLVSARGQKKEQEEGMNAGASAYMVKPFEPDYLLRVVNKILNIN